MNDKIKELQRQIREEENNIRNCDHEWGDTYSNPETIRVPYGYKSVAHGSDIWIEAEGYRDETKPRWSRKCEKCGKVEHTYKQKPIIKGYDADFK